MSAQEKRKPGRPVTIGASSELSMRVSPEWLARVRVKAKSWGMTTAQLVRLLVEQGLEGDMAVLFPPGEDPDYVPIHERLRKGGGR